MGKPAPIRARESAPVRAPRASLHAHKPTPPRGVDDRTAREVIPWHVVEARRAQPPRAPQPCIPPAVTAEPPPPPPEMWATLKACEDANEDEGSPPSGVRVPGDAPPAALPSSDLVDEPAPTSFRAYSVEELDVRMRQSRLVYLVPPAPKPWTPVGRALWALVGVAREKIVRKNPTPLAALADAPLRALAESLRHALRAPSTKRNAVRAGIGLACACAALFAVLLVADATDDVSVKPGAGAFATQVAAPPADPAPAAPAAVEGPTPAIAEPPPAVELDDAPPPPPPRAKAARRAATPARSPARAPSKSAIGQRVSIRTAPF